MSDNKLLEHALAYARLGWRVLPIQSQKKIPLLKEWQRKATVDADAIREWWRIWPWANIGIATGRESGFWCLDIDPKNGGDDSLDKLIAEIGPLPDTVEAITGGGGRHILFLMPEDGTDIRNTVLGPGLDIRGDGGQIVVEPSVHPSGGMYVWEASSSPLDGVAIAEAPAALIAKIAAPKVVPFNPNIQAGTDSPIPQGMRDNALASIAGQLRRMGLGAEAIAGVLHAENRRRCQPPLPDKDIERIARSVARYAPEADYGSVAHGGVVAQALMRADEAGHDEREDHDEQSSALPNDPHLSTILNPPGVLREIVDYILATARQPQPVLAVVAAMSLAGLVLGRKVMTEMEGRTNLYLIGVAGTAAGKNHGRQAIKRILRAANLDDLLGGEEIASGQGLLARVASTPNVLFQLDEFGLMMQSVQRENAGNHQASILVNFIKLFDQANTVFRGAEYADQKHRARIDIPYGCAHIHATTTPETFYKALNGEHVVSGYLNRMLVVESTNNRPPKQWPQKIDPPENVLSWIKSARNMSDGLAGLNPETPICVKMSPSARARFDALEQRLADLQDAARFMQLDALWGRAWEHASKIALVCACARDVEHPVIDEQDAAWAITFVEWSISALIEKLKLSIADSPFEAACNEVLRIIRKGGRRGKTERELAKSSRLFRGLTPRERDNVFAALVRNGEAVQHDLSKGAGRPRLAWVDPRHIQQPEAKTDEAA